MCYKKVLFIDSLLHKRNATGITLSNLFEQWPKDKLFFISDETNVKLSYEAGYNRVFIITDKENRPAFPLNLVRTMYWKIKRLLNKSGRINEVKKDKIKKAHEEIKHNEVINVSWKFGFLKLFYSIGLNHHFFRYRISKELLNWIIEANPDVLYTLAAARHNILLAKEINRKLGIPIFVHILDDYPATFGLETIFPRYWNKKINSDLISILKIAKKRIAISEMMANEYQNRFGGIWEFFHNPIKVEKWIPYQKDLINQKRNKIKIGYFGRIGTANAESILSFSEAVCSKELDGIVDFHIYSLQKIDTSGSKNIIQHEFITASELPSIISKFDFLFLPISFSKISNQYSRLSFPTKLSEYLISGVPIIYFGPKLNAISNFLIENECGFIINDDSKLIDQIIGIIRNINKQALISNKGKLIAIDRFNSKIIAKRFKSLFEI